MGAILGFLLIIGGVLVPVIIINNTNKKNLEMQYMQTTSIKDACDLLESMKDVNDNYRHYVELKGISGNDTELIAPFSNTKCVYYEAEVYTVNEETTIHTDSNGNKKKSTKKVENLISKDISSSLVYLKDSSSSTKIYLDCESFENKLELKKSCDRISDNFSGVNNNDMNINNFNYNNNGTRFIGYRLVERIIPLNTQLYVLGELYNFADKYTIGNAAVSKKTSLISFKSEEEIVELGNKKKKVSILAGVVSVAFGLFVIVSSII